MIGRREFGVGALLGLFQNPKSKGYIAWSSIELPTSYTFDPHTDITAFELAKILPFFFSSPADLDNLFKEMPEIKRHFKEIK